MAVAARRIERWMVQGEFDENPSRRASGVIQKVQIFLLSEIEFRFECDRAAVGGDLYL
jgi:hypothetical protein